MYKRQIQELEREKQAQANFTTKSKHDIEALTLKVNEELKREVAELRRQQDQEKALLLHQCVFPIELVITNIAERKSSNRMWRSPPFYSHPRGYKLRLTVYANGYGKGKDTHVSVFAHLMRGEFDDNLKWPFQYHVTVAIPVSYTHLTLPTKA